jgi:integrase
MATLTCTNPYAYSLSMNGKVRTRERCPQCGKNFTVVEEADIYCPDCQTRPKTYYIFLYWDKGKYRIARDPDGNILDSYRRTHRLLETMRREIDNGVFKISNYAPKEIEEFRGHTLLEAWMKVKKAEDLSPLHLKKVWEYVDNYFKPCFKKTDCRKIDSNSIETFFLSLPEHLSIKTKKNIMTMLKNFCYYLLRREILSRMPYFHVLSPPQPPIIWITKEDQGKIIEHIRADHRAIFYFLMYHPVRISESTALKIKDFNLQNRSVYICRAFSCGELRPRKNKRCYYLPLSSQFDVSILRDKLPEAFVFTNAAGKPYRGNDLRKMWKKASRKAGIKIQLKNATRHSIASQALNDGVPLEVISKALGHSTLEMTKQRYANMEIERLRVVVNGNNIQEMNSTSKTG